MFRYHSPMGQLRITSGTLRNRKLTVPETGAVRPMLEKPRMAIFSILGQDCAEGGSVIDCFAGTGILALEAVSRGAEKALLFDTDKHHVAAIRSAAETLGVSDQLKVVHGNVIRELVVRAGPSGPAIPPVLRGFPAVKLVYVDPPHAFAKEPSHPFHAWFAELGNLPGLAQDCVIVYGHHSDQKPPEQSGRMLARDTRKYGEVALTLYWEPQEQA